MRRSEASVCRRRELAPVATGDTVAPGRTRAAMVGGGSELVQECAPPLVDVAEGTPLGSSVPRVIALGEVAD